MASAEAQIQIAVKNLNALTKLDKQLNKINKTNEALLRGLDKLTLSIDNLARSKGFENISKGASAARKEIDEANKSMSGFAKLRSTLVSTSGGRRALGIGVLGLGVGGNSLLNSIKGLGSNIGNAINPLNLFRKNVDATAISTGVFGGKITALGSAVAAHPAIAAAAAVAYMAFGDKIGQVAIKGVPNLIKGLAGIGQAATNSAGLAIGGYKDLELQLELTRAASVRLNAEIDSPRGRISSRNRAFGVRQVGSPAEEQVRRRNRRINEMAARHREDKLVTTAIAGPSSSRAGQTIRRLKSIDANQKKTAVESKKSNSILSSQSLFGPTAYQPTIPGLGPVTSGTGFTAAQYGPQQLPNTLRSGFQRQRNRLGIGSFANPQGMFASRKGAQGRIGGAITSGMIGGGFPALFGQSPLASLFGGIGGAAGGALGGGLGFGLSIAGTAMAQRIQETIDFRKSIKDLNVDMKAMGFNAGFNAREIIKLGKSLGITKQEAVQVAEQFKRFGKQGALFAQAFGGDYGAFTATAQATEVESAMAAIKAINKDLSLEEELRYTLALRTLGVEKTIDQLLKTQLEKQRQKVKEGFAVGDPDGQKLRPGLRRRQTQTLNEEDERIQETIDGLKEAQEQFKKLQLAAEANSRSIVTGLEKVNRELRKLNDPQFQIVEGAKAISEAFSTSFKGIITGTMSVQQAFANMFNRIADHFADMAAQMAANQLQKGILSLFTNAFTSSIGSSLGNATLPTNVGGFLTTKQAFSGGTSAMVAADNLKYGNTFPAGSFSTGGMVTRPTVGLVGEAGEDEYIIPASKMASSMQRYSAGARGEAVIPGTGSSYAGSGGSSTTVNYSGPILNFNSEEFVPKSAVGQIIATATSQGARAGENRTLTTLRNSRSTRSRLGM